VVHNCNLSTWAEAAGSRVQTRLGYTERTFLKEEENKVKGLLDKKEKV
jgi:hypothetical protein